MKTKGAKKNLLRPISNEQTGTKMTTKSKARSKKKEIKQNKIKKSIRMKKQKLIGKNSSITRRQVRKRTTINRKEQTRKGKILQTKIRCPKALQNLRMKNNLILKVLIRSLRT